MEGLAVRRMQLAHQFQKVAWKLPTIYSQGRVEVLRETERAASVVQRVRQVKTLRCHQGSNQYQCLSHQQLLLLLLVLPSASAVPKAKCVETLQCRSMRRLQQGVIRDPKPVPQKERRPSLEQRKSWRRQRRLGAFRLQVCRKGASWELAI